MGYCKAKDKKLYINAIIYSECLKGESNSEATLCAY